MHADKELAPRIVDERNAEKIDDNSFFFSEYLRMPAMTSLPPQPIPP